MLLNSLEYRGNDAAGVALIGLGGDIYVHKDHEPAWNVTCSTQYRDFVAEHLSEDILCALVHTRKATKGSPFRNDNNHPLIRNAGVCVHNGMLSNDDFLFGDLKLERGAETDSDILRAILDAGGGVTRKTLAQMSRVSGSVASALVHPSDPTKLMLLRSGNPLVIGDDGSCMYFASDKRAIYRAARPWIQRHGFPQQIQNPQIAFLTMPNDTGWIVGNKGLEWHDKFTSSAVRYRYNSYSDVYSPHSRPSRRERFKEVVGQPLHPRPVNVQPAPLTPATRPLLAPIRVENSRADFGTINYVTCPNPACDWTGALTDEQAAKPLNRFRCKTCKTNLGAAVKTMRALQKADAT